MTSGGKRKPRYGFGDIGMPRRLPRSGSRRQPDNALGTADIHAVVHLRPVGWEDVSGHRYWSLHDQRQMRDIGKIKGLVRRGLAARAPYFHNGSAATLPDVVEFYNQRFGIGLTAQ